MAELAGDMERDTMVEENSPVETGEILVVDDIAENLKILSAILSRSGYRVRRAQSGSQALDAVRDKRPDLILLDILMPDMDGHEVCRRLKEDERSREIPVIFLSALDDAREKIKSFQVGGVDYITKPFHAREVVARIDTHLQLRRLQMELKKQSRSLEREVDERRVELAESRQNYARLVEDLPVGIYRCSFEGEGRFLMANPAMARIFGLETAEELERVPVMSIYRHSSERQRFLDKLIRDGSVHNEELKLQRRDGTPLIVSVTAHMIRDVEGNPLYIDGMVEDITGKKWAEAERNELELQLRQAQKMEAIGTLAGGIAHDFNNILSAILGYTELALVETEQDNPIRKDLQQILVASHRARELTRQILTISRQRTLEPQPTQVKVLVKEVCKLLKASLPPSITIKQDLASDSLIVADPTEVHQVLMNLCTNAAFAMRTMPAARLEVALHDVEVGDDFAAAHQVVPGPYLQLTIGDNGCGIAPEYLERIFDPFFTTKGEGEGTGLGLSVVHAIVKSFNGAIRVRSEVGKGTVFEIFWPVVQLAEAERIVREQAIRKGSESILLIDDEPAVLAISQRYLEKLGYAVTALASSTEAFELFRREPCRFDLVISDLVMPNMTGDILARKFLEICPNVPIIFCTGFKSAFSEEEAMALGVKRYILKPVNLRELASSVREVLDRERASRHT